MKTSRLMVVAVGLVLAGCDSRGKPAGMLVEPSNLPANNSATLRYVLPPSPNDAGSSAATWGLAAPVVNGVSDPNKLVYDSIYVSKYVEWAIDSPIACGGAEYAIVTPDRVIEVQYDLDEAYLGLRFRAEDLIRFLKTRAEGRGVEQTFRVESPDAAELMRSNPDATASRRLSESPWIRDVRSVVALLALARYKPAYPVIRELVADASPSIRYSAIMATSRFATDVPEALEDLRHLLADKELGGTATDSLKLVGGAALPVLIEAMDHRDATVRNGAVHALAWIHPFQDAVPGVLAALNHSDPLVRSWAVDTVLDIQSRGVGVEDKAIIEALTKRSTDSTDQDDTRRKAEIALGNLH